MHEAAILKIMSVIFFFAIKKCQQEKIVYSTAVKIHLLGKYDSLGEITVAWLLFIKESMPYSSRSANILILNGILDRC